jgi:ribonuclease D
MTASGAEPSATPRVSPTPWLVADDQALAHLAERLEKSTRLAVDAEANGMFAYRARLCVLQLAWHEEGTLAIAVVDALAVDVTRLAPVLGSTGPVKVLHDLTFDARLLGDRGIEVGNVRDTSVAARFLGEQATGLARLVASRCGASLRKELQEHDWSRRPFEAAHLDYLSDDVRYLLQLDDVMMRETEDQGIREEVHVECAYKLACALRPPRDNGPAHTRIMGYQALDALGRSVLRRLCNAREVLAEQRDVPPFRIARSNILFELARRKPGSEHAVRLACGRDRAALRYASEWQQAVSQGLRDGPEARTPSPSAPGDLAARRALERALGEWRRHRASERRVDPQVVLPGHCLDRLAARAAGGLVASAHRDALSTLRQAIASIEGFGNCRLDRYGDELIRLMAEVATPSAVVPRDE